MKTTMAKSEYRGQDVVREMIRARVDQNKTNILSTNDAILWNDTCNTIAGEMSSQGLHTTAAEILKHKLEV